MLELQVIIHPRRILDLLTAPSRNSIRPCGDHSIVVRPLTCLRSTGLIGRAVFNGRGSGETEITVSLRAMLGKAIALTAATP